MRHQLFLSLFAAIVTVAQTLDSEEEAVDDSLRGYDHTLVARDIFAEESYEAAADYEHDIDTSLDGYDHEVIARDLHQRERNYKRAPLHVRDALSEDAYDLIHEHGQDVDISLDGYDHDLVAREVDEESIGKMKQAYIDFDNARKMGSMKPRPIEPYDRRDAEGIDQDGDDDDDTPWVTLDSDDPIVARRSEESDDDDDDDTPWVDLDPEDPEVAKRSEESADEAFGANYEPAEDDDDDDDYDDRETPSATLGADHDEEDHYGSSPMSARDIQEEEDEADEDIDYSLDGYDHSLLRRGPDEEDSEGYEAHPPRPKRTVTVLYNTKRDESMAEQSARGEPDSERKAAKVDKKDGTADNALVEAWSTVKRWIDELVR